MRIRLFAHAALAAALLSAAPAAAQGTLKDLNQSLATTGITAAALAGADDREAAIREMINALDKVVSELLKGGADGVLSAEELDRLNKVISEGVAGIEKLRDTGTVAPPPATTPPTGTAANPPAEPPAQVGTVDVNTRLNVRDGVWGTIIGKLTDGQKLEVVGRDGEWLKIKYNGAIAYVHSRYVNLGNATTPGQPPVAGETFTGHVATKNGGGLNVRSAPWGPIVGQLNAGATVQVKGREGDWYVVEYDGKRAYISADYVEKGAGPAPTDPPVAVDPPKPGPGGFTFPVGQAGSKFCDTWGAARSGGRKHEGTDIFNKRNTPLVAVRDGRMGSTSSNSLGGNCVRVTAGDVMHYYAHLDHIADVRPGQNVKAGTVVGYMGDTGNAKGTPFHLHFGMYRGGKAFNPYPTLNSSYPYGKH